MKKILVSILIGVMLISSLSVSASANFSDVNTGDWYYQTVTTMTQKGLFKGKGNNMFCPNDTMTRAEFITVVVRALYPTADISSDAGEKWWQGAYKVAVEKGILEKDEFVTYNVNKPLFGGDNIPLHILDLDVAIQRQEMALISVRALYALGETNIKSYTHIPDINAVNSSYKDYVSKAYGAGIIVGDERGNFNPNNTLTRAEASTVLYRIIEKSARASVDFDLQGAITIYEGQERSNRLAKEGDTFVKADGTHIILKKGPNGVLGEGQGVAPDVGLVDTVGQGSNVTHPVLKANGRMHTYSYGLDSVGGRTGDAQYLVNPLTGEGHWPKEWSSIPQPNVIESDYDTLKVGQISADKNFVWTGMLWKLVVDAPNLVKKAEKPSENITAPITIYEGQERSNRLAKEGDTFVKADGTQIVLKKGPNGVLGEGQGVAPDVGLIDTVGQGSNVTHPVLKANGRLHTYSYGLDSVGGQTGDTRYQVNLLTGEGHWEKEWTTISLNTAPKVTEENYDTLKAGQISADKNFVWTGMLWKLVVDAPNLVKK